MRPAIASCCTTCLERLARISKDESSCAVIAWTTVTASINKTHSLSPHTL
jgi:glyceraldehyde-3-phosphate dehydrogenase/erythrose-4-phosphate dehydrogenase